MTDSQLFLTDKRERKAMAVTTAAVATVTIYFSAGHLLPPAVCLSSLPIAWHTVLVP